MTKRVISDFLITNTQEYTSPHIFWETSKCVIRGETIKFSTQRKKKQSKQQHLLESKLIIMESLINKFHNEEKNNLLSLINNSQNELN